MLLTVIFETMEHILSAPPFSNSRFRSSGVWHNRDTTSSRQSFSVIEQRSVYKTVKLNIEIHQGVLVNKEVKVHQSSCDREVLVSSRNKSIKAASSNSSHDSKP
jgi:hypothetical protein